MSIFYDIAVTYKIYYFWKKDIKNSKFNIILNAIAPYGTVPNKWHLKWYERAHILKGHYKHLKEYTNLISEEFVNFKCFKKIKTKFWENEHITKKVQFLGRICWYIWNLQKILILFKFLLLTAYFLNFFHYRKGALCVVNFLSHVLHWWGFSPVWVTICTFNLLMAKKRLSKNIALIRLFTCMSNHVNFKGATSWKRLSTI